MAQSKGNQEPSMEDILASIRKIVTDEDGEPAAKAKAPSKPGAASAADTTAKSGAGDSIPDAPEGPGQDKPGDFEYVPASETAAEGDVADARNGDVLVLTRMVEPDGSIREIVPAAPGDPPAQETPPAPAEPAPAAAAVTKPAEKPKPAGTLPETTPHSQDTGSFSPMAGHNQTLETLVIEALEPKVRAWLDENLDRVVREVVAEKIDLPEEEIATKVRKSVRREIRDMLSKIDDT